MEQYNVYKDGKKITTTTDKKHLYEQLQADTSYKLGVSRVIDGKESKIITVSAETDAMHTPQSLSADVSDYHIGGGYYELPNGDKVRGKDNAVEVLERLLDE